METVNASRTPPDDAETDFGYPPPAIGPGVTPLPSGAPEDEAELAPASPSGPPAPNDVPRPERLAGEAASTSPEPVEAEDEALGAWKTRLRAEFERWLDTLEGIPENDDDEDFAAEEAPDLYAFFEQLTVLNAESRRSHRRTAEAFSQWGEVFQRLEGELGRIRELATQSLGSRSARDSLGRDHCLALVELLDRMQRLGAAFARTPPRRWLGGDAAWRQAWAGQQAAFQIVADHLEALLRQEGVTRLEVLDQAFDPVRMVAVAAEADASRPAQTVLEEVARGYLWQGELLRPAQVKVVTTPVRS